MFEITDGTLVSGNKGRERTALSTSYSVLCRSSPWASPRKTFITRESLPDFSPKFFLFSTRPALMKNFQPKVNKHMNKVHEELRDPILLLKKFHILGTKICRPNEHIGNLNEMQYCMATHNFSFSEQLTLTTISRTRTTQTDSV